MQAYNDSITNISRNMFGSCKRQLSVGEDMVFTQKNNYRFQIQILHSIKLQTITTLYSYSYATSIMNNAISYMTQLVWITVKHSRLYLHITRRVLFLDNRENLNFCAHYNFF